MKRNFKFNTDLLIAQYEMQVIELAQSLENVTGLNDKLAISTSIKNTLYDMEFLINYRAKAGNELVLQYGTCDC